ncbi:ATP-dependent helicase, partial [Candidatus Parcubacteria bacterium]
LCIPHFEHILVDEYQDLNRAEQVLIRELARQSHLVVVGDENQSIYSFKFAHPEGILQFHQENPGTRDHTLNECRRCPRHVVELANALISNNTSPAPRALVPATNDAGEVYIVQWRSLQQEAEGLARFIEYAVHSGLASPGDILVLTPRRQIGYSIRDALKSLGIPAHSFFYEEVLEGDPKKLEASKAQQAFALLMLLVRPEDRVALRCWCGFGSPSLNSGAWARLREYCEETGTSPRAALEELLESRRLRIPRTGPLVNRYRELKEHLSQWQGLRGHDLLDALFPAEEEWAEELRSLAPEGDDFSAEDLLNTLRTAITQPETPTDVDYVRVMSLHKAKGLSADVVIVAGCVEGLIPAAPDKKMSDREKEQMLEEHRRLFYVAITRTRRILVLSSVTRIRPAEAHRMRACIRRDGRTVASRFLSELGPSHPAAKEGTEWLNELGVTV